MYHNPVGYAHGLLNELDEARRAGREEIETAVLKELAAVRRDALQLSGEEVGQMSDEGKADLASLRSRLAALDSGWVAESSAADADGAGGGDSEPAEESRGKGRPRTTKAAAAPESAVKPQPK